MRPSRTGVLPIMVPLEPGFYRLCLLSNRGHTDCGSSRTGVLTIAVPPELILDTYNGRRRERGGSPQRPADLGVVDDGCTSGGIHQEGRAGQDGNRNPSAVTRLLPAGQELRGNRRRNETRRRMAPREAYWLSGILDVQVYLVSDIRRELKHPRDGDEILHENHTAPQATSNRWSINVAHAINDIITSSSWTDVARVLPPSHSHPPT